MSSEHRGRTVGEILDANAGVGRGFDTLRVVLAVGVVLFHEPMIVYGAGARPAPPGVWMLTYSILPMFFTVSGFLVAASAMRLNLRAFLINRSLRIFPGLGTEIALSALILGPILTTLPILDYFRHPVTWHYFTNFVGIINYRLPGLFEQNPTDAVNFSLWTIPYELGCYVLAAGGLILFGAMRHPRVILLATLAVMGMGFVCLALGVNAASSDLFGKIAKRLFLGRGAVLYVSFLLGVVLYAYRHRLAYDGRLFAACLALCLAVAVTSTGHPTGLLETMFNAGVAPSLAYITVFLGVSPLPKLPLLHRGDYSYGIYLYGMPVQQAVKAMAPVAAAPVHLLIALPLVVLFAMFSWHVIEKPCLRLRGKLWFLAGVRSTAPAEGAALASPKASIGGAV